MVWRYFRRDIVRWVGKHPPARGPLATSPPGPHALCAHDQSPVANDGARDPAHGTRLPLGVGSGFSKRAERSENGRLGACRLSALAKVVPDDRLLRSPHLVEP